MLTITMHDEHGYSAIAQQRTESTWDVRYYRDGELDSDGWISTPPPYLPPTATLVSTLDTMRREADYWAKKAAC